MAERVGFEPTVLSHTAFRERHHQPLGHLSAKEVTASMVRSPEAATIDLGLEAHVGREVFNQMVHRTAPWCLVIWPAGLQVRIRSINERGGAYSGVPGPCQPCSGPATKAAPPRIPVV